MRAALWSVVVLTYAATTARDVLPADSGEFQLITARWGIAHPPGYPLYTMVGALWVRLLPIGSLPFRLNLLSAVMAATTLVIVAETIAVWAQSLGIAGNRARRGAVVAALALGQATTFWAQATTANIRMPTLLFVSWGYLALARLRAARESSTQQDRALMGLAIATGLGVGHHPSLAFVAAGWSLYVLLEAPSLVRTPRRWARPLLIAAASWIIPHLYLPIRGSMSGVPLDPGGLATWQGFWNHVLARGFGGDMFAFANAYDLRLRLPLLPTLFRMQFPVLVLLAMAGAGLWLLTSRPKLAVALIVPWAVQTFITITYRAPQTIEYLMPAYIPMVLSLGLLTAHTITAAATPWLRSGARGLTALVVLSLCVRIPGHLRDFVELAADTSIRERAEPILRHAPGNALILADWHWATPLWVIQSIEGIGATAEVEYVAPQDNLPYEDVWRAKAAQAQNRPLYSTHYYGWEAWSFAPVGGGYRLYPAPQTALPADLGFTQVDVDLGSVRLVGYHWLGAPAPGASLELQLAWRATEPSDRPPSFATRIWSADGALLSAADRALGDQTSVTELHFTQLTHQIPVDRCTGTIIATVGVYEVTDEGFQDRGETSLPALTATCTYPKLPTARPWPGVVLASGPFLRGVDYDTRPEGATTAYLHWCGPGQALVVRQGDAQAIVQQLASGACQTVSLSLGASTTLAPDLARPDGTPVRLFGLPCPAPRANERYVPFGAEMVLVGDELGELRSSGLVTTTLTLAWRTAKPLQDDYAVSVRLLDDAGAWLGIHDMQPGLSTLPTLKWVTRGDLIRDPHPIAQPDTAPTQVSIVVYERFRLTPLRSVQGEITLLPLR